MTGWKKLGPFHLHRQTYPVSGWAQVPNKRVLLLIYLKNYLKDYITRNHNTKLHTIPKNTWISINLYKCTSCNNIFLNETAMKRHTISKHMPKNIHRRQWRKNQKVHQTARRIRNTLERKLTMVAKQKDYATPIPTKYLA